VKDPPVLTAASIRPAGPHREREKEAIIEWIRRFTGEKEVERNKGMEKIKRQGRLACGPLAHRGVMHY
jgi:hypothetical protein